VERRDEAGVQTAAIVSLVSLDGKLVLDVGCAAALEEGVELTC
jgi:hypothetical protein